MAKLQQIKSGQFTLTLPKDKVKEAGWQKGQQLSINYDRRTGEIIIGKLI